MTGSISCSGKFLILYLSVCHIPFSYQLLATCLYCMHVWVSGALLCVLDAKWRFHVSVSLHGLLLVFFRVLLENSFYSLSNWLWFGFDDLFSLFFTCAPSLLVLFSSPSSVFFFLYFMSHKLLTPPHRNYVNILAACILKSYLSQYVFPTTVCFRAWVFFWKFRQGPYPPNTPMGNILPTSSALMSEPAGVNPNKAF